jgi:DNA-binding CsgD family transcriptional regulator
MIRLSSSTTTSLRRPAAARRDRVSVVGEADTRTESLAGTAARRDLARPAHAAEGWLRHCPSWPGGTRGEGARHLVTGTDPSVEHSQISPKRAFWRPHRDPNIARGSGYADPDLGAQLVVSNGGPALEPLSDRERDVLHLLALGYTNQEISKKLFISVRTVDTHRAHIMRKLSLETRAELVLFALANGLIGPS